MANWGSRSARKAPLPTGWHTIRLAVFARDNHRCVDCGWHDPTNHTLECDHIGAPDDHRLTALATRCGQRTPNNCHGRRTTAAATAARHTTRRPPEPHPGERAAPPREGAPPPG